MKRTEDGGILIDGDTIDIGKDILVGLGGILILSKILNVILGFPQRTHVTYES
jgi:hypothetical protein